MSTNYFEVMFLLSSYNVFTQQILTILKLVNIRTYLFEKMALKKESHENSFAKCYNDDLEAVIAGEDK